MLAEVDELLDETLTEMGEVEGATRRLDSVEYQIELNNKLKEREQHSFGFQAVATHQGTEPDTFKHLDRINKDGDYEERRDKQIEFAIEEEDDENAGDEEKDLD